ncbi:MAG: hypothetical protein EAX95_07395 [Candidatus Thorarchaeota archaeon]|nr:hypothetical protein [Candidatus Thorarchaeota archaeon]
MSRDQARRQEESEPGPGPTAVGWKEIQEAVKSVMVLNDNGIDARLLIVEKYGDITVSATIRSHVELWNYVDDPIRRQIFEVGINKTEVVGYLFV